MKVISAEQVHAALSYPALIDALGEAYAGEFKMPPRQVFLLDDDEANHDAFAVLPSWGSEFIGVKAFTYFPTAKAPYKSLYSQIMLFDRGARRTAGAGGWHHGDLLADRRHLGSGDPFAVPRGLGNDAGARHRQSRELHHPRQCQRAAT